MASIVGKAQQTTAVSRTSEGRQKQVRVLRDGALVNADWITALTLEGRVHGAQTGTGTTPDTLNDAYTDAQQDFYVYVPAGTLIIPLHIGIQWEDSGQAGIIDCFAGYSSNGDSAVTGTALTIRNYKTLASPASSCTATAIVTSGGTTHLGGNDFLEFWRPYAGTAIDAFTGSIAHLGAGRYSMHNMEWDARQFVPPFIGSVDQDCALSIFASDAGTDAGTGFITVIWAELDASAFA